MKPSIVTFRSPYLQRYLRRSDDNQTAFDAEAVDVWERWTCYPLGQHRFLAFGWDQRLLVETLGLPGRELDIRVRDGAHQVRLEDGRQLSVQPDGHIETRAAEAPFDLYERMQVDGLSDPR